MTKHKSGLGPVGVIGLGAMGLPMARALLRGGFVVRGYDLRSDARAAFAADGGIAVDSARTAAAGAAVLMLMVVDAAQAESVLLAECALDSMPTDGIVLLTATCPPTAVQAVARRVLATGRGFVDAPVSGGTAGATAATLTVMAAGAPEHVNSVRPLLETVGKRIFVVGSEPGQGAVVKAVNQLLCGAHIAVAAEGLTLARRLGVDGQMILDVMGRLRRPQLDAERSRPAHAAGAPRSFKRRGHLREGSRHRPAGRARQQDGSANGGAGTPAFPCRLWPRDRGRRRQPSNTLS